MVQVGPLLFISVWVSTMKKFRFILTILLSSLIIVSGGGISVMHYCCAKCQMEQCCGQSICKSHNKHQSAAALQKKEVCSSSYFKVDWVKNITETPSLIPSITFFCGLLPQTISGNLSVINYLHKQQYWSPPDLFTPRHVLALFSILII
jgi:hypothetical protein